MVRWIEEAFKRGPKHGLHFVLVKVRYEMFGDQGDHGGYHEEAAGDGGVENREDLDRGGGEADFFEGFAEGGVDVVGVRVVFFAAYSASEASERFGERRREQEHVDGRPPRKSRKGTPCQHTYVSPEPAP